jgi:hypothetical protein
VLAGKSWCALVELESSKSSLTSAGRLQINREISHEHVTALREVMLEEKSIYLVFEYAEHDFLVGVQSSVSSPAH